MGLLVFDFRCPACDITKEVLWERGEEVICECGHQMNRCFSSPHYHQSDMMYIESAGRPVSSKDIPPKKSAWV